MGCINSKVESSAASRTHRRKTRGGNLLLRNMNNILFRKNRVVPGTVPTQTSLGRYHSNGDVEEQLTSFRERDTMVKPNVVLFKRRFSAENTQNSRSVVTDSSDIENSSESETTSLINREDEHDKGYDILVIDHSDTEDSDHMSMINVKERLGGVAFELTDDDETTACLPEKSSVHPMTRINDTRSSKGGVAFDIDFTDDTAEKTSVYPVARMNDTRSSKGGVAFDIDFTDDAAEKRTLTTISKVASIMARDGWSERDVINEADDVWVANKVLAVKDNARRSQERLAARKKAELDYDMITATMTDDDLQDFHFIGMKETSTERSLLRQTFYRAWLAKLRA